MSFFEKYNVQEEEYENFKDILGKLLEISGVILAGVELTLLFAYYTIFADYTRAVLFLSALAGLGIIILIPLYLFGITIINRLRNHQLNNKDKIEVETIIVLFAVSYGILISPLTIIVLFAFNVITNYSWTLFNTLYFVVLILYGVILAIVFYQSI